MLFSTTGVSERKRAQSLSASNRSPCLSVPACLQTLLQKNLLQIRKKVWVLIMFKSQKCKHWRRATTTFLLHAQVQELPSTLWMGALQCDAVTEGAYLPGQTQLTWVLLGFIFIMNFRNGFVLKYGRLWIFVDKSISVFSWTFF